ncbi:hypothetical protein C0585_05095 [Candidatus Woesearchaeota archaeon]|nr:MAG: hypothetical protein C0585_05095 [Candidatus Woesearchaeota archaeon]
MNVHSTTLKPDDYRKGSYPIGLDDAASILVSQMGDAIPISADVMGPAILEKQIIDQRRKGNELHSKVLENDYVKLIESYRTQINSMMFGLQRNGYSGYNTFYMLSQNPESSIVVPKERNFQFEIFPHSFDLGLTGRVLTDGKDDFLEDLNVECSIYDAYDLASMIGSKSLFARMKDGTVRLLKTDRNSVGEHKKINNCDERKNITFDKGILRVGKETVLDSGISLKKSDGWKELMEKYKPSASLVFGYEGGKIHEFLDEATKSPYLFWRIASLKSCTSTNSCIAYLESGFDMAQKYPEQKDRFVIGPSHSTLYLDNFSLYYSPEAVYNSLMGIKDLVTDIWIDPLLSDREIWHAKFQNALIKAGRIPEDDFDKDGDAYFKLGRDGSELEESIPKWDIIYDRRAGIEFPNVVKVRSDEIALKYAVNR